MSHWPTFLLSARLTSLFSPVSHLSFSFHEPRSHLLSVPRPAGRRSSYLLWLTPTAGLELRGAAGTTRELGELDACKRYPSLAGWLAARESLCEAQLEPWVKRLGGQMILLLEVNRSWYAGGFRRSAFRKNFRVTVPPRLNAVRPADF